MRLEAQVYNLLNTQFRGVPDPFVDDTNFAAALTGISGGSFANTFFNNNGGDLFPDPTIPGGLGRRRMILGAKFTF